LSISGNHYFCEGIYLNGCCKSIFASSNSSLVLLFESEMFDSAFETLIRSLNQSNPTYLLALLRKKESIVTKRVALGELIFFLQT
jgi:hypothetical protein